MQRRLSSDVQALHCSAFWRIVCRQLQVIYNNRLRWGSVILSDSQSHTPETHQWLRPATGFEGRLNGAGVLLQDSDKVMLCTGTVSAIQELPRHERRMQFCWGRQWHTGNDTGVSQLWAWLLLTHCSDLGIQLGLTTLEFNTWFPFLFFWVVPRVNSVSMTS